MGELEGAGSSTSDDDEDDGNREGSGGDGSGDETRGDISKGAPLSQIRDVIQVIFFFFFQGSLNQILVIQIALYRGRTVPIFHNLRALALTALQSASEEYHKIDYNLIQNEMVFWGAHFFFLESEMKRLGQAGQYCSVLLDTSSKL